MTWLVRALVALLLGIGSLVATALPSQAATCNVSRTNGGWRATCPTSAPYTYFQMRVHCSVSIYVPYTYTAYGPWATQGSGSSFARCNPGHREVGYTLAFG